MNKASKYDIRRTEEYIEWYESQTLKSQTQIDGRLIKIEYEEYFGFMKDLGDGMFELKFNDGRRIYYVYIPDKKILLLLGGNKNGQDKDIKKARNIFRKKLIASGHK